MGWKFRWVSSSGTDFNFDHQASFTPEEVTKERALYNFTLQRSGGFGAGGDQRILQGPKGSGVSRLFDLCAGHRHDKRGLPSPRPGAQGSG